MTTQHTTELTYAMSAIFGKQFTDKITATCKAYKVERLKDIPDNQYEVISKRLKDYCDKNKIDEMIKTESEITCPKCGEEMYPKGMFFICDKCRKII